MFRALRQAGAPWFHVAMESFEDFVEDVAHGDGPTAHNAGSEGNLFLAERRLKVETPGVTKTVAIGFIKHGWKIPYKWRF